MSTICIEFDCPVKINYKKGTNNSFDCSMCHKKVHDFTNMSDAEFSEVVPTIQENELCGIYRADQISNDSKLNWKSRLIKIQDNLKHRQGLRLVASIMGIALLLVGCRHRHTAGVPAYGSNNQKQNTEVIPSQTEMEEVYITKD